MDQQKRNNYLVKTYGITLDDYNRRLESQDGRCAICRRLPRKYVLCVDHDHKTGRIRGLLCIRCNRHLGAVGDNLERVMKFVEYLKKDEEF